MRGRLARQGLPVLLCVVSLIQLHGVLTDVYGSALPAVHVTLVWLGAAAGFEAATFVSTWAVQRIALRAPGWWDVVVAQTPQRTP